MVCVLAPKLADLELILANVQPKKSHTSNSLLLSSEVEVISDDPDVQTEKRIFRRLQPKMNDFVFKTSMQQKEDLDAQIARLFYACNLPFSLAEHDIFKQTFDMLRPGYAPPKRKKLTGPLLDKIYDEVIEAGSFTQGKGCYPCPRWMERYTQFSCNYSHCTHRGKILLCEFCRHRHKQENSHLLCYLGC